MNKAELEEAIKRKDCEYRHENGNCLKVGGFCTSVSNKYCPKCKTPEVMDLGIVLDDDGF